MSDLIRLAAGDIPAFDLLANDAFLVVNFPRQTDMRPQDQWSAVQPELGAQRAFVGGLEIGSGGYVGLYETTMQIFITTPKMREFIETTYLNNRGIGKVTMALHDPLSSDFQVFTGELVSPFAVDTITSASRFDEFTYSNVTYAFRRGKLKTLKAWGTNAGAAWGFPSGAIIGKVTQ
jgi:hypothetical protein